MLQSVVGKSPPPRLSGVDCGPSTTAAVPAARQMGRAPRVWRVCLPAMRRAFAGPLRDSRPTRRNTTMERDLELTAYETSGCVPTMLVKSPIQRPWMDQTPEQFAHRCLPLTIANQMGWVVLNPHTFTVWWSGGARLEDLVIQYPPDSPEAVSSAPLHQLAARHARHLTTSGRVPSWSPAAPNPVTPRSPARSPNRRRRTRCGSACRGG